LECSREIQLVRVFALCFNTEEIETR
jgi:hypothetical protein